MNLTEATIRALCGDLNEARSHKEDNEKAAPRDNNVKRVGYVKNSPIDGDKDVPKRAIYRKSKPYEDGSVWGRYDKDELDTYEKSTPDIERYKELKKDADAERSVAKYHNNLAQQSDDMASDIVRDKKLDRAKKSLQGKQVFNVVDESKLVETDATSDFLEDLKNLINKHMRVGNIKNITIITAENGDEIANITYDNGTVIKKDVTGESNLAITRSILNRLAY